MKTTKRIRRGAVSSMPKADFRAALERLDIPQTWLATQLGVSKNSVNRWAAEDTQARDIPIPVYMPFVLELLGCLDEVDRLLVRGEAREIDDDLQRTLALGAMMERVAKLLPGRER